MVKLNIQIGYSQTKQSFANTWLKLKLKLSLAIMARYNKFMSKYANVFPDMSKLFPDKSML